MCIFKYRSCACACAFNLSYMYIQTLSAHAYDHGISDCTLMCFARSKQTHTLSVKTYYFHIFSGVRRIFGFGANTQAWQSREKHFRF